MGSTFEYLEDQHRAVEHFDVQRGLEVTEMDGRQFVIEYDHVGQMFADQLFEFDNLA